MPQCNENTVKLVKLDLKSPFSLWVLLYHVSDVSGRNPGKRMDNEGKWRIILEFLEVICIFLGLSIKVWESQELRRKLVDVYVNDILFCISYLLIIGPTIILYIQPENVDKRIFKKYYIIFKT